MRKGQVLEKGIWNYVKGDYNFYREDEDYPALVQPLCVGVVRKFCPKASRIRITLYYGDCPEKGQFIQFEKEDLFQTTGYTTSRKNKGKISGGFKFDLMNVNPKIEYMFDKYHNPVCTFKIEKLS